MQWPGHRHGKPASPARSDKGSTWQAQVLDRSCPDSHGGRTRTRTVRVTSPARLLRVSEKATVASDREPEPWIRTQGRREHQRDRVPGGRRARRDSAFETTGTTVTAASEREGSGSESAAGTTRAAAQSRWSRS